jgi:uncharacterized membrane protein
MSEETHPIVNLTDEALQAMLGRAMRLVLMLGLAGSVAVLIGGGWRNAAMLATGAAISAASVWEWRRMTQMINARMEQKKSGIGGVLAGVFFVLRLTVFAAVLYGSLKCFRGSVAALLCGLALAIVAVGWQAMQLLRD